MLAVGILGHVSIQCSSPFEPSERGCTASRAQPAGDDDAQQRAGIGNRLRRLEVVLPRRALARHVEEINRESALARLAADTRCSFSR
jgi:hypothetical protein